MTTTASQHHGQELLPLTYKKPLVVMAVELACQRPGFAEHAAILSLAAFVSGGSTIAGDTCRSVVDMLELHL